MLKETKKESFPAQEQEWPAEEGEMSPEPLTKGEWYRGSEKLLNQAAVITGGDSGIGRAIAVFFAREGADVSIIFNESDRDAQKTKSMVEEEGRRCLSIQGDIRNSRFCSEAIEKTFKELGRVDILVNNAGVQKEHEKPEQISDEDLEDTFRTNIFSQFYLVRAALKYMKSGSTIINTTSVNAYHGHPSLIDYSATKGAIVAFTRALALNLADRGIRVNAVAPGPIWTPLIVASYDAEHVKHFGENTLLKRAGQPEEVAPSFVFLASQDSSYMTGQVLHPNGGYIVNG